MTIREMIRHRIKEIGVKQVILSQKIGVNTQNFTAYLKGNRPMPFEALDRLCEELNLTISEKVEHPTDTVAV